MYEKVLKIKKICPQCGRTITTAKIGCETRCWALVPRSTVRAKGESRKVRCNAIMQEENV